MKILLILFNASISLLLNFGNLFSQNQNVNTFQLYGRERDSTWFRYKEKTQVIFLEPTIGIYHNNLNPDSILYTYIFGSSLGYGYFIDKSFMLGGSIGYSMGFKDDNQNFSNTHLQFLANYYFLPNRRHSPFLSIQPQMLRYAYTRTNKFTIDDNDLFGVRSVHYIPSIYYWIGWSIKFKKRLTFQFTLGADYRMKQFVENGEIVPRWGYPKFGVHLWYHFMPHAKRKK